MKNAKAATLKSAESIEEAKLEFASEKNWDKDHSQFFSSKYLNK